MSDTGATFLAPHAFIKGELHFDGPAIIAGRVEGRITAQERLEIAPEGIVDGDIHGLLVDIQGTVKGNVLATHACRLGASARVTGELRAANLAIAEGACFVGQVCVGGTGDDDEADEAPHREEEKSTLHAAPAPVNRIESLASEAAELAEVAASGQPAPSVGPSVRVVPQNIQQTLNRGPRIIKAR